MAAEFPPPAPRPPAAEQRQGPKRIETLAVLIISLTAVLTAWTTFQSSKWAGLQDIAFAQSQQLRTDSEGFYTEAGQELQIDVQVFVAWLEAVARDDDLTAAAIEERFPPTLEEAFLQWVEIPEDEAPASPFEVYTYENILIAEDLEEDSDALFVEAQENNQRSDNYTAMAIVFATVILFAALADKVPGRRSQAIMLGIAGIGLLGGAAIVATFPVTV